LGLTTAHLTRVVNSTTAGWARRNCWSSCQPALQRRLHACNIETFRRGSCSVCSQYLRRQQPERGDSISRRRLELSTWLSSPATKRPLVIALAKQGAVAICPGLPALHFARYATGQRCAWPCALDARTGEIWLQCSTRIRWRRGETTHRRMTRSTAAGLLCMSLPQPTPAGRGAMRGHCAIVAGGQGAFLLLPKRAAFGEVQCRPRQLVWHGSTIPAWTLLGHGRRPCERASDGRSKGLLLAAGPANAVQRRTGAAPISPVMQRLCDNIRVGGFCAPATTVDLQSKARHRSVSRLMLGRPAAR
jgi:hypothetical protein